MIVRSMIVRSIDDRAIDRCVNDRLYEAPYGTKLILFYRHDFFHSDSHFTNRNDGFYLSQWWTLLIELKVSIISIAFLSIDRCTHRNFHIDRTIKKHRLIDVMYRSIDTKVHRSIRRVHRSIRRVHRSIRRVHRSIRRVHRSMRRVHRSIDTKGPSRSIRRVHRSIRRVGPS